MVSEFETWWHQEGSRPPAAEHDFEEHCKRMCEIAWKNGAFVEREACARIAERSESALHCAFNIRARGQA